MSYNLNDDVNEAFEFELDGHKYKMRYPLLAEIEELAEIGRSGAESTGDAKSAKERELMDQIYALVTPVSEGAPKIADALKRQNIKVVTNFSTMWQKEFGLL